MVRRAPWRTIHYRGDDDMLWKSQDGFTGIALIIAAFALYYVLIPGYVADNEIGAMSPRFFPKFGTILIGIGGIVLFIGSLIANKKKQPVSTNVNRNGTQSVICIAGLLAGFILLFQWLGCLYAAPPVITGLMIVFGARHPLPIVLVSAATTAILYIVFSYGLNLPLV